MFAGRGGRRCSAVCEVMREVVSQPQSLVGPKIKSKLLHNLKEN